MLHPLFAYFGPETVMPLASIVGAIGGVILMFGRSAVRLALRFPRIAFRKEPPVSPEASD